MSEGATPISLAHSKPHDFATRRGHLGHEEVRHQRRHLFIACDISSGRRTDVPAKTTPVWQIRETAPAREIRRPMLP